MSLSFFKTLRTILHLTFKTNSIGDVVGSNAVHDSCLDKASPTCPTTLSWVDKYINLENSEAKLVEGGPPFPSSQWKQSIAIATSSQQGPWEEGCSFGNAQLHRTKQPAKCSSHVPVQDKKVHQFEAHQYERASALQSSMQDRSFYSRFLGLIISTDYRVFLIPGAGNAQHTLFGRSSLKKDSTT